MSDSTVPVQLPRPSPANETPRRNPLAQPRIALRIGSSGLPTRELENQLRKRLRFSALFVAVFCALQLAITLPMDFAQLRAQPITAFTQAPWHGMFFVVACLEAAIALWLSPARRTNIAQLRAVEWLIIVPVLTHSAWSEAYELTSTLRAGNPYHGLGYTHWALLIVGYGVVIPNTWYRCAAMVALIALIGFLPHVLVSWAYGALGPAAIHYLALKALWFGVAGAIVVYGAYRIETLSREVVEARKLGQYELKERLGVGGMGEVHLAEHVLLRRPCAIKLVRPERAGDPTELLRFEREVRTTATLTHPNTIQIFDYGHADDGTFYYVMEYLPGLTLSELVRGFGPLPPARAVHFLRQICGALREAHAVGLIHRDIKPSNVMVCQRGGLSDVAKLLDFGLVLSPVADQDGERLTQDGANPGTPAYMSPEQAAGRSDVDARSDIYGVGCLAYFLLTGQPPFAGRSAAQMLAAHICEPPASLTSRGALVPPALELIVLTCLAKEPSDRLPTAGALDNALASCPISGQWTESDAATWWQTNRPMQGSISKVQN